MSKTPSDAYDPNSVETPLEAYENFMAVLEPLDTLMEGTRGMQAAGTKYLPQEIEEENVSYENRLKRTKLVNYFRRTIERLAGEVFSKPVTFGEDLHPQIEDLMENIDNNGKDITRFAFDSFKDGLHRGITHILVDYPQVRLKTEGNVKYFWDDSEKDEERKWKPWTKANEDKGGFRPNWIPITAEQIIGWRTEIKQGKVTLTQIRIEEQTEEPDGEYGQVIVNRIRVFTPDTWEIHTENDEGTYELTSEGTNNLGYIPLISIYFGERVREMVVNPPLEGLADLNIMHWQSTSDQRNILHFARLVIYFGKGIEAKDGLVIGPNRFILSDEPDSDLKVVEHSGEAIGAGRVDIRDIETQMALFGLTVMMPKTGSGTATERAIDSSENDSSLKAMALSFEDGLNEAVQVTADYLKIDKEKAGMVFINTEFQSYLMSAEAQILIDAKDKRILPRSVVIEEFMRRGIIREDSDPIEIERLLEKELESDMPFDNGMSTPLAQPKPAVGAGTKVVPMAKK